MARCSEDPSADLTPQVWGTCGPLNAVSHTEHATFTDVWGVWSLGLTWQIFMRGGPSHFPEALSDTQGSCQGCTSDLWPTGNSEHPRGCCLTSPTHLCLAWM